MTSQLLRKHPITLWSMLLKTEGSRAGLIALVLRDAGLAGLAMLTLASAVSGQEPARGSWTAARPATQPRMSSDTAGHSKTPLRRAAPVRTVSATAQVPNEDLYFDPTQTGSVTSRAPDVAPLPTPPLSSQAVPQYPARPMTAPEIAAQAKQQIAGEPDPSYSRSERTDEGFSARMDYVLSGGVVSSSSGSVGDLWQERSGPMMSRNQKHQHGKRRPVQKLASVPGRLMGHGAVEYEEGPDFYDASPIAVFASDIEQTALQETSNSSGDTSSVTPSRLRTDIREIKPTLSYALKNIEHDQLPEDFDLKVDNGEYQARQASPTVYQWAPTNFWHYPLYFQDPSLERYGHTYHPLVQPFASTSLFAGQLVGLPYQMTLHPVHSRQYALGYYRPGECAPKKHYAVPFNEEATIVEVATIAGLILIIP